MCMYFMYMYVYVVMFSCDLIHLDDFCSCYFFQLESIISYICYVLSFELYEAFNDPAISFINSGYLWQTIYNASVFLFTIPGYLRHVHVTYLFPFSELLVIFESYNISVFLFTVPGYLRHVMNLNFPFQNLW